MQLLSGLACHFPLRNIPAVVQPHAESYYLLFSIAAAKSFIHPWIVFHFSYCCHICLQVVEPASLMQEILTQKPPCSLAALIISPAPLHPRAASPHLLHQIRTLLPSFTTLHICSLPLPVNYTPLLNLLDKSLLPPSLSMLDGKQSFLVKALDVMCALSHVGSIALQGEILMFVLYSCSLSVGSKKGCSFCWDQAELLAHLPAKQCT